MLKASNSPEERLAPDSQRASPTEVGGNSKMYESTAIIACAEGNGLRLSEIVDDLGICHSLLRFVRSDPLIDQKKQPRRDTRYV